MVNQPDGARWLLLIQQLPTRPSSVRIKTWRRLQQLGSVVLKNSVYVLPQTAQAREDFEWLCTEIRAANGHASIMAAEALTSEQDEEIRQAFRAARTADYEALRARARDLLRRAPAHPTGTTRQALERAARACRDELAAIESIDFCGAPTRAAAADAVNALASKLVTASTRALPMKSIAPVLERKAYAKRTWVTRPRPGVDRMASAWLIQRFIDPAARFTFADGQASQVANRQIPFDMFGAEFGHQGDRCSFEALCESFAIDDLAVRRIAQVVHDVDLKDRRFNAPEAPVVAKLIEGLRASFKDDHELLKQGMTLFAGLYESFGLSGATPPKRGKQTRARVSRPSRGRR